jgi:nucleoside-diphosphate-sugar epimerase
MMKIAVLGATGPTGIHLVTELRKTVATVRVIARSMDILTRLFPEAAVEKWEADIRDPNATCLAIRCTCIRWEETLSGRFATPRRDCVQVSSYWAYYPQVRAEMNENHPRSGGPPWVRYRREAENVPCEAGAAILHLPDFYGPQVRVSTLQNAFTGS